MDELVARVYVSWGLWVAQCPRPDCIGAEHYGHAPVTGTVGGLTLHGFRCALCGLVCRVEWPENADTIWRLLAMRPLPHTRSWNLDEPIEDLLAENAQHGLIDPERLNGLVLVNGRLAGAGHELVPPPRVDRFAIGGL